MRHSCSRVFVNEWGFVREIEDIEEKKHSRMHIKVMSYAPVQQYSNFGKCLLRSVLERRKTLPGSQTEESIFLQIFSKGKVVVNVRHKGSLLKEKLCQQKDFNFFFFLYSLQLIDINKKKITTTQQA